VYNSLLVLAYLRKLLRQFASLMSRGFSSWLLFAKLVAEIRNEIIHKHVGNNFDLPKPMIKLFRKIRQNMIKENKISKYLLYAIGEVTETETLLLYSL